MIYLSEKKLNSAEVAMLPENQARIAEFKKAAEAQEAKDRATAVLFDPVALLSRGSTVHEVVHPKLGKLRFGELVIADSETLNKCKTKDDRTAMTLYLMLKKAYPELPEYTPETIGDFSRAFPMLEGAELVKFIGEQPGFLLAKSNNGSNTTPTPKPSA